jgi:hypothetical protein
MEKNREGYLVSETHRQCTNCFVIFEKTSKTVTLCPTCNSGRVKTQCAKTRMYRRAKRRAKEKGIVCSITPEDICIPERCPILDIPLYTTEGKSGAYKHSPSLDRKDSSRGYEPDNIWVISQLANAMKSNATVEDLKKFAEWIETL